MKALLLEDAPPEIVRACEEAALAAVRVGSAAQGRVLLARDRYELVDGRLAMPAPLEEEIHHRVAGFFDRLGTHGADGLYHAVMRAVERPLIAHALARAGGVRAAAAAHLGIDRGTLARRMRALGIGAPEERE
jgi:Fis family transcriptional regulator